jgi:hypothetical protein
MNEKSINLNFFLDINLKIMKIKIILRINFLFNFFRTLIEKLKKKKILFKLPLFFLN